MSRYTRTSMRAAASTNWLRACAQRRLLLGAEQASAVGRLIDAAVQTTVGEDKQRPRAKHALAKWLLARRDVIPPDNACERAGILLAVRVQRIC